MCFMKTPSIDTSLPVVTGRQLVAETTAETPDSPQLGDPDDIYKKKKGKSSLLINRSSDAYNPTNM